MQYEKNPIRLTIDEAMEVFSKPALKPFSENGLKPTYFDEIKTFEDAVKALGMNSQLELTIVEDIEKESKASAAMYKLNIVRKALNLGQDLHLTKNPEDSQIYYPYNLFVTENSIYYERDYNAALNILDEGLRIIGSSTTEFTLVDYPTVDDPIRNDLLKAVIG